MFDWDEGNNEVNCHKYHFNTRDLYLCFYRTETFSVKRNEIPIDIYPVKVKTETKSKHCDDKCKQQYEYPNLKDPWFEDIIEANF